MEVKKLMVAHPIVGEMADYKEVFWINPKSGMEAEIPFGMANTMQKQDLLVLPLISLRPFLKQK